METQSLHTMLTEYLATRLASTSVATQTFLAKWPSALFELQMVWTRQFLTLHPEATEHA
jgi:hypothetical protein